MVNINVQRVPQQVKLRALMLSIHVHKHALMVVFSARQST